MAEEYKTILASSISFKKHLAVFDKIFATRLDQIDLSVLLIYLVDNVHSSALSNLADQFDVLGYKGWYLTTNDDERRTLIKEAIKRKRYAGTPWAVKSALLGVGYTNSEIVEGMTPLYDGTFLYNGEINHGGNGWAFFSVNKIDIGEVKGLKSSDIDLIKKLIDVYKRQSAHLVNIGAFTATMENEILISELDDITIRNASNEIIYEGAW